MTTDHPSRSRADSPEPAKQSSEVRAAHPYDAASQRLDRIIAGHENPVLRWPGETAAEHIRNALALLSLSYPTEEGLQEIEMRLNAALSIVERSQKETREALQILNTSSCATDDLSRVSCLLTVATGRGNGDTPRGKRLNVSNDSKLTTRLAVVSE